MGSRPICFSLLVVMAACTSRVAVPTPPSSDAISTLLFADGSITTAHWSNRDEQGSLLSPNFVAVSDAQIYALDFLCPTEALAAPAVTTVADEPRKAWPFGPNATQSYVDDSDQWQELTSVPADLKEQLTRINWEPPAICSARVGIGEVTSVPLPPDNRLELVAFIQMADGRIFLPAASPNAYWYDDGVVTVEPNVPPDLRSGYLAEGDDMFLLDKHGVVHKGHPERGFNVFTTGATISDRRPGTLASAVHILKGSPSGDEMYLACNHGLFGYEASAGWTQLADGARGLFNVEWVEPGLAYAVGVPRDRDGVLEVGPGQIKRRTDLAGGPGTLRYFEPWGYIISADDGQVYHRNTTGDWVELFTSSTNSLTIPYGVTGDGGMLTGTADRKGWSFGVWYPGDEHCVGDTEIEAYVVAQQKLPNGAELMATQVRYGFAESFSLYERKTTLAATRCGTEQW